MRKVVLQISDGKNGLFKLWYWGLLVMKEVKKEGRKKEKRKGRREDGREEGRILPNTIHQNRKVSKTLPHYLTT